MCHKIIKAIPIKTTVAGSNIKKTFVHVSYPGDFMITKRPNLMNSC